MAEYKLSCLVYPGGQRPIKVQIQSTATISQVAKQVRDEENETAGQFSLSRLRLYRVDAPGETKKQRVQEAHNKMSTMDLEDDELELDPGDKLSRIYSSNPPKDVIHIVVLLPSNDIPVPGQGIKRKLEEPDEAAEDQRRLHKILKIAPSSLAEPARFKSAAEGVVCCNRPFEFNTIPIDLLQPEFGEFDQDCAMPPTVWAQNLLEKLTIAACEWQHSDSSRRSAIQAVFNKAGIQFPSDIVRATGFKTDDNSQMVSNIMPPVIRGCKNQYEAVGYYARFLHQMLPKYRHARFPCILMVDIGPSIAFYGCLWTGEKIHLEPLTPGYDLRIHWTDEISRNAIASSLDALKKIISRLERYSQDLATLATLVTTSSKMRMFPYPTSYEDETKVEIRFTYRSRIDDKLIFRAAVNGSDEDTLCIKFTRRYSEKAHRLLAELGHAPRLRAVSSLPGGWIMIVMDLSRYDPLYLLPFPPRSASESKHVVRSKIRDIVQKLHDNNLVHGDIRDINILVDRKTIISKDSCAIHLLDFDWAGTEGEVRYPERVNTKSVRRPDGVSDRELITKGHDMAMVDFLWAPPIGGMFSNSS